MKKKTFDKYVKTYKAIEKKAEQKVKITEKNNLKDKKNDVTASR
jgi:hypothetical protein